jgi:hypothetical protein
MEWTLLPTRIILELRASLTPLLCSRSRELAAYMEEFVRIYILLICNW